MPDELPPLFVRLWLALICLFRIVLDAPFAAKVAQLRAPALPPGGPGKERPTLPATPLAISAAQLSRCEQALHLLALFQREGRLVDFCEEELGAFSDAQIGAAARTVHDGCRKAMRDAFTLAPIRSEAEGAAVTIPGGFDPNAIRLTGNLQGNPPFKGVLKHHGWKVTGIKMSHAPSEPLILAPAEVELV